MAALSDNPSCVHIGLKNMQPQAMQALLRVRPSSGAAAFADNVGGKLGESLTLFCERQQDHSRMF